jgi:hypothetical protein
MIACFITCGMIAAKSGLRLLIRNPIDRQSGLFTPFAQRRGRGLCERSYGYGAMEGLLVVQCSTSCLHRVSVTTD